MNATIDPQDIQAFVRVVGDGSYTRAAASLGLPKSSISRRVARLEATLGVRLLQRTTRKLALTEAGARYHVEVARALAALDDASRAVSDLDAEPRGVVRLTAPVDMGSTVLSRLLTRFVRRHPGVHVDVVLTGRLVDLVAEGFDLAIRAGRLADSSLIGRKVGTTCATLVASPGYLRRRGVPASVAELAAHDCVLFRGRSGRATWTLVGPEGPVTVEVEGPLGGDDFTFVRSAVLAGAGIGLLPTFIHRRHIESGRLVLLLPAYASGGGTIHVVYPSARHVPQRVALLRDFLVEELAVMAHPEPSRD